MRNHHTLLVSSLLAERSKALAVVGYASILADSHTGPFVNFGRGQKVLPVHCPVQPSDWPARGKKKRGVFAGSALTRPWSRAPE